MFISCSSENDIWNIPDTGRARIAGYWCPDQVPVAKPAMVEWQKGCITGVNRWSDEAAEQPFLDWSTYYLMPGWLDAHVHLALDAVDFQQCFERWPDRAGMEKTIHDLLENYLRQGIVGIRDGGDQFGYGWLARQKVAAGEWRGPNICSVREAIFRTGLYGRLLGHGVRDLEDWRAQREQFFGQGLEQCKIIISGLISFHNYGVVGAVQWNLAELTYVVADAHRRGLKVMAHVSGTKGIDLAIQAGVDTVEHGYYMTSQQLHEIRERGMAWVPTVAPVGNLLAKATHRYTLEDKSILRRILAEHLERIYEAFDEKVLMGVGTDAGAYNVPHAQSLLDEMIWFAQAGIPTLAVRRMATADNARILGWYDYGKLETGTRMDTLQLCNSLQGPFA